VKQLVRDFNTKIKLVYRYFPLEAVHPYAVISAHAAEAARQQGKFWEMHDLLFEHQNDWTNSQDPQSIFISYAQKIGLDVEKFKNDINSDSVKKFVSDEENAGITAGINATPTFFLNGKQITNPTSYDAFKNIVQNSINK
jgi:protein-disulfide isomerase